MCSAEKGDLHSNSDRPRCNQYSLTAFHFLNHIIRSFSPAKVNFRPVNNPHGDAQEKAAAARMVEIKFTYQNADTIEEESLKSVRISPDEQRGSGGTMQST